MAAPLNQAKLTALNSILLILIAAFSGRNHDNGKTLYLDVYGRCEESIVASLDKHIVFERRIDSKRELIEVRRGPYYYDGEQIELSLAVDGKDTTFTYPLKEKNYWSIGYSKIRNEFQFTISDSTDFFFPGI